jgi:hypothetical protein
MFKTWGKIQIRFGIKTITNHNTGKTDADGLLLATPYSSVPQEMRQKTFFQTSFVSDWQRFDADPNPVLDPISVSDADTDPDPNLNKQS